MYTKDLIGVLKGFNLILKALVKNESLPINKASKNIKQGGAVLQNTLEDALSEMLTGNKTKIEPKVLVTEATERLQVVIESLIQYSNHKDDRSTFVNDLKEDKSDILASQQQIRTQNLPELIVNPPKTYIGKNESEKKVVVPLHRTTLPLFPNEPNKTKQDFIALNANKLKGDSKSSSKNILISMPNEKMNDQSSKMVSDNFESKHFQSKMKKTVNGDVLHSSLKAENMNQKLANQSKERRVPVSRVSRFLSYGSLMAGLGLGTIAELTRTTLGQKSTSLMNGSSVLTEANANRIVSTLCRVRGAALKLGQILSLQDNTLFEPELQAIFERVRQSADFMPSYQMEKVMTRELGDSWRSHFITFENKPFAAASIGQVHKATLLDGRDVAVKIQYPGVAEGIESDLNNLMGILSMWNILPKGLYIEKVVEVARRELAWEVDYIREAKCCKQFRELVKPYPHLSVPEVISELSTQKVLTCTFVNGISVDKLSKIASQEVRNKVGHELLELCLRELFCFRFMQTDPNWANFFYDPATEKLTLLDFGACRSFDKKFIDIYIKVIKASSEKDRKKVGQYLKEMGFLTGYEIKKMEEAHIDAVIILGESFATEGFYNFANQDATAKIHTIIPTMLGHRLTPPPEESYSLHRKLSGMFLLCTKLGANINCREIFNNIYNDYKF